MIIVRNIYGHDIPSTKCQADIYCASLFRGSVEQTEDECNNSLRGIFVQSLLQLCEFVQRDLIFLI